MLTRQTTIVASVRLLYIVSQVNSTPLLRCAHIFRDARAKTSCIGKHVEPCYRFHQQLHIKDRRSSFHLASPLMSLLTYLNSKENLMNALGKRNPIQHTNHIQSLTCFSCNHSNEMHHMRHKEILKLVRKISALDEAVSIYPATKTAVSTPSNKNQQSSTLLLANYTTDTAGELEEVPSLRRSERKKAKKMGGISTSKKLLDIESFPLDDTNFISEAIHLSIHESRGAWEGTYIYGDMSHEAEEEVAEESDEAIGESAAALCVKPMYCLTPTQRRLAKKVSTPFKARKISGNSRRFSPKDVSKADPYDGLDPQMFSRLGIKIIDPPKNSICRKDLVAKLVAEIKNDLAAIAQEDEESNMRQEGFWRWAGRAAYHTTMKTREEIDWATGMKKGDPRESFVDEELEDGPSREVAEAEKDVLAIPDNDISYGDTAVHRERMNFEVKEPALKARKDEKAPVKKPEMKLKLRKANKALDVENTTYDESGFLSISR
jgi:hypothetical protein